ncbi:MAG: nickel pincer cofactor biosynthesis protein LarB [Deltaproteobacteria bacterium]|nr:nickel pincer cofactor biosynthesis protein LarB [Deltaproteobacteria bacterium]
MNGTGYEKLLGDVAAGRVSVRTAAERLAALPFIEMGHTKLDTHRPFRQGFPEVVMGQGKLPGQVVQIVRTAHRQGHVVLVTRVGTEMGTILKRGFPAGRHDPVSRTFTIAKKTRQKHGLVAVVTAGTSDIPVAEEAAVTLDVMGHRVERIYDVGVAGIHRLFKHIARLRKARAVVVAAGMEGALASVVGGLVAVPVIAVPVSTGYGASFGGVAALLGMLNSCSMNVAVVNIDNGFGAAAVAGIINGMDRHV